MPENMYKKIVVVNDANTIKLLMFKMCIWNDIY